MEIEEIKKIASQLNLMDEEAITLLWDELEEYAKICLHDEADYEDALERVVFYEEENGLDLSNEGEVAVLYNEIRIQKMCDETDAVIEKAIEVLGDSEEIPKVDLHEIVDSFK